MSKSPVQPLAATLVRKGETVPPLPNAAPPTVASAAPLPKVGSIAVTVRLDPNRYERLKAEATSRRITNQAIIVEALDRRWGA